MAKKGKKKQPAKKKGWKNKLSDKIIDAVVEHGIAFVFSHLPTSVYVKYDPAVKKKVTGKQIDFVQDIDHEVISTKIKKDQNGI